MILPFSRRRSRTSFTSNCLYCASLTPRAMFSKSMKSARFRSPFIRTRYCIVDRDGKTAVGAVEDAHETAGRERRASRATGPDADDEVAGAHVRAHAALRSEAMDVSRVRPGRARAVVLVGGIPAAS